MQLKRKSSPMTGLNVTPLIDVVFILLVFFMLATNFAAFRLIRVDTPQETEVTNTAEGAIVIELGADGAMTFDTRSIEAAALYGEVAAIIAIDPGRPFLIRPNVGVPLQDAIRAYDTARAAGAVAVSFSPPAQEEAPA